MFSSPSFLTKLKSSTPKFFLKKRVYEFLSESEAIDFLEAETPEVFWQQEPHLLHPCPPFAKTFTSAFDKKIAEENKKLSEEVLSILRMPPGKNRSTF